MIDVLKNLAFIYDLFDKLFNAIYGKRFSIIHAVLIVIIFLIYSSL